MLVYETELLNKENASEFLKWFNQEIGTEIEETLISKNEIYFICLDLTHSEVDACREHEITYEY